MAVLSHQELDDYGRDGFLFARELFSRDEIKSLGQTARNDHALDQASALRDDGQGNDVRLSLWNHPGDGVYGMFARCRRVVERAQLILQDEVYHYHSKMILKDAKVGGAWAWHQDYGYWYQNGLLYPDLCSVMIAVDDATKQNGCLQVLRGSHRMGRINHVLTGDQAGADMERVKEAQKVMETVHCEMKAGDALIFHSNLLHCSAANLSDHARWALICCYNARRNHPYKESHHPGYTPLQMVDDDQVLQVGQSDAARSGVRFADLQNEDRSAKSLSE